MLVTMNEILPAARREGRAVGAFNIGNYETALAVVRAAEELGQPVIVQLYSRLIDNGHGEPLGAAVRVLAEQASVPVALHLDHGSSVEQVRRAIAAGFTSVMLDASKLPFDENVAAVREAVKLAREAGGSIESEIGHVPMGGSTMAVSQLDETVRFYEETKVDALAVSIGTAHGFYKDTPKIDVELARRIGEAIPIPLVLHGGSGTPPEKIRAVIACGIAKVNIATEFQYDFQQKLKARLLEAGDKFIAADLLMAPVVDSSTEFIKREIRFLAGI